MPIDPLPPNLSSLASINGDGGNNVDMIPPGARVWPSGEVELPRFFILDEHDFTDDKTGKRVNLTRERLQHIAARCNTRRKRTGDLCPIIVGHTEDHAKETDQPPIVGYLTDYAVEPFFDTGKFAIAVTPVAKSAAHVQYFRDYPRRSVELWLDPDDIDPLALLGPTTPRRDLGLHKFSRESAGISNHSYILSEPNQIMTPLNPVMPGGPSSGASSSTVDPNLVREVSAAVMQLPFLKQLEEITPLIMSFLSQAAGGAEDGQAGEGDDLLEPGEMDQSRGEGDEPPADEDEDEPEGDDEDEWDDEDEPEDEDDEDEGPNKKNASHCGPNNTSLPGSSKMSRRSNPDQQFRDEAIVAWYAEKYNHKWTPPSLREPTTPTQPAKLSKKTKSEKLTTDAIKEKEKQKERTERVKFQKELAAAHQRIAELEEKNLVGDVVKALTELDELEIPYNPEREIKRLVKMSREEWPAEIAYIKQIATGAKRVPPVNPVTPESQASVKFSARDGGARSDDTTGGPKTVADAHALANKVARGELTQAEVLRSLQSGNVSISVGPTVPVR